MVLMYPWSVLEIAPSHDKKDIKRAYAKKLKKTRPDENSQAFLALHRAYKEALSIASSSASSQNSSLQNLAQVAATEVAVTEVALAENKDASPSETISPLLKIEDDLNPEEQNNVEDISKENSVNPNEVGYLTEVEEIDRRKEVTEQLIAQMQSTLKNNKGLNNKDTWQFLLDSPLILDDAFNWPVGLAVFKYVAEHNVNLSENASENIQRFESEILIFFDSIFSWSHHQEYLYEVFERPLCDAILTEIVDQQQIRDPRSGLKGATIVEENKRKAKKSTSLSRQYFFGNLLIRSLALFIDFLIIAIPIGLIVSSPLFKAFLGLTQNTTSIAIAIICSIPLYLLMALVLESSNWQATPAKRLLGLQVMNKDFERIGFSHNFIRIICFLITLPFGKISWIINCFLRGNLLHDRLSRSYVINIRKSS